MSKVFLCYQSASEASVCEGYNTNILAICDTEELARVACCHDGDSYIGYELNEILDREVEDSSENCTYNVNGNFVVGYSNVMKLLCQ